MVIALWALQSLVVHAWEKSPNSIPLHKVEQNWFVALEN